MLKIDKERILSKVDELDGYLQELTEIVPRDLEAYEKSIRDKRACERLLQISIETVIDILNIINSKLRLGLPSEEEDLIERIYRKKIISKDLKKIILEMKGFRNIIVHKYGEVDDELVFEILSEKISDFDKFRKEIIEYLNKN
ncbi:MAG: type VII toxin-antitoxin system HepT family RNase toxin [Minisyncoccales bacterium]